MASLFRFRHLVIDFAGTGRVRIHVIPAVMLESIQERRFLMMTFQSMISSWIFWAFLSSIFAALTAIFAKVGVQGVAPNVATFVRTIVILIVAFLMLYASNQVSEIRLLSRRTITFLVVSGLAAGASWVCYFRALSLGNASQVAPIDKLSVAIVAILATIFLKEQLSASAWLGISFIVTGSILVAISK